MEYTFLLIGFFGIYMFLRNVVFSKKKKKLYVTILLYINFIIGLLFLSLGLYLMTR